VNNAIFVSTVDTLYAMPRVTYNIPP